LGTALQLSREACPEKSQLKELQGWPRDSRGGGNFLDGVEFDTWQDDNTAKYVTAGPPLCERDPLTRLLRGILLAPFHFVCGARPGAGEVADEESGLARYGDSGVDRVTRLVAVVLASVMPVTTIFALDAVGTLQARVGMIASFTGLFALALGVCTSATRAEIFAATAT
jgi:hypothetical protein